jgi:hypothetical protein
MTFNNIYSDLSTWKTLQDCLLGYYDYQRDTNGNIVFNKVTVDQETTTVPVVE